jgi:predicted amidophosphoribosyltransferase
LRCRFSYENLSERTSPVKTKYLFNWNPLESDSLSAVFLNLKSAEKDWKFFAKEFWKSYLTDSKLEFVPNTVLIPVPSKTKKEDHAFWFCRELSTLTGIPMLKALAYPPNAKSQKRKSRRERRQIRFDLAENISFEGLKVSHVILVDDIVTTGETALAARRALRPLSFEVWALASRALSCGNPLNLL